MASFKICYERTNFRAAGATISWFDGGRNVSGVCRKNDDTFPMMALMERGRTFRHFAFARYATDVIFQQSNRPVGTMREGKHYYSGKHKLYGLKTEVPVFPTGLAIGCSKHYGGSVAHIEIMSRMKACHKQWLEKKEMIQVLPMSGR